MLRKRILMLIVVPAVIAGCSRQPLAPEAASGSAAALTASGLPNPAASASAASKDTAPVFPFPMGSGPDIPGAYSTLIRNDAGVTMTIHTSGLVPGNAYTVWWVIFNNPAACVDGCGLDDLLDPVRSVATRVSLVFATGHVVGNDTANFGAWLGVGDLRDVLPKPPSPAGPYGLENARTAEVHLVIRSHGPADPQLLPDQINSFLDGCSTNSCANVQASAHLPQTP